VLKEKSWGEMRDTIFQSDGEGGNLLKCSLSSPSGPPDKGRMKVNTGSGKKYQFETEAEFR
jgi:hypothetical protein